MNQNGLSNPMYCDNRGHDDPFEEGTYCPRCREEIPAGFDRQRNAWFQEAKIPSVVFDPAKSFPKGHPSEKLDRGWKDLCKQEGAVILTGGKGVAKSAWACSKLYEIGCATHFRLGEPKRPVVLFARVQAIIIHVRSTWGGGPAVTETEKSVYDKYINTPLLVMDEIGGQNASPNEQSILNHILMERFSWGKDTIMTTNIDPTKPEGETDMEQCLGSMIWDRIKCGAVSCMGWPRVRGV